MARGKEWVHITDVGPRDGLQNQAQILTIEQRLQLIHGLTKAGVKSIEVGSFVSPKAVPAMAGTDQVIQQLSHFDDGVQYQALIPNLKGYQLAQQAGAKSLLLVVCASQTMNQKNIRMSVEESIVQAQDIIALAKKDGIEVLVCIAVAWECPFEGKTDIDTVLTLAHQLRMAGADKLVFADTIGAANPLQVKALMQPVIEEYGSDIIGCHFHDTRAMGMANVYAAIEAGVRQFDASVGGLGGCPFAPGTTGNVATEDVVMMLAQMGFETGIDLLRLMEVGQLAGDLCQVSSGGRASAWRHLQLKRNFNFSSEF
ncbi:hydroxymethylglutaryl-CoA lyase [Thalassotalea mangrovi]|uniref:Hydroxymethylglutaryl-CoA lyase n=1 Tax=Thalassotalea mangrovi TaxID=2572245 RepID=A0A4U1B6A7_9GAMM|nr:hydroxymethylglutaryl-CoA lyase [Thalassotalea mangrovi]TKB46064.1 hydroxymethylglutaryl-CoA lyase [Thalassotalea mangrovi]